MARLRILACLLFVCLIGLMPGNDMKGQGRGSGDPPCAPGVRWLFRPIDLCAEDVVTDLHSEGIVSISALVFGPEGGLYFARPATRSIMRMMPMTTARGLLLPPEVFIADLPEPPNGLAYDPSSDSWYISGDTTITRVRDGAQQVIVGDLPGGAGGWLGNIRIGPDGRLYVAKAASCLSCIEDDPRRAALLSFAPDGGDMRIVAVGLRSSFDFGWNPADGALYIADDERPGMAAELNALRDFAGEPPADFGWPYCDPSGAPVAGVPGASPARCETVTSPAITFDVESRPAGMAFYEGDAFPEYRGSLLVALSGSWNATTIAGYELVRVAFDADGQPTDVLRVLPFTTRSTSDASLIRTSFYPYRLTGLAVSPEGWIYVGVAEGRIYRFRPMPGN